MSDATGAAPASSVASPHSEALPLPSPATTVPASPQPAPALREDQIQNAVSFLAHPNVRASPAATKRSFLQRKGLTEPEIDEAFRRVPDAPLDLTPATPAVAATASAVPSAQGTGLITYVPQRNAPSTAAPGTAPAESPQMAMVPHTPAAQPVAAQPIRWTQVVLGFGVVAASVYAVHTIVTPYLARLYNGWSEALHARQEEQERQRKETRETLEALRKVQDQLLVATENMAEAARAVKDQLVRADETRQALAGLTAGLKQQQDQLLASREQRSGGGGGGGGSGGYQADSRWQYEQYPGMGGGYGGSQVNGLYGGAEVRAPPGGWLGGYGSSSGPTGGSFQAAPSGSGAPGHGNGGGGSAPGAGRQQQAMDDGGFAAYAASPGPSAPGPYPGAAPTYAAAASRPPAAATAAGSGTSAPVVANGSGAGSGAYGSPGADAPAPAASNRDEPVYPKSFQEVMEMVSKGITPPNVRTDINDKPPDPSRLPTQPRVQPRPKPWESSPADAPGMSPAGGSVDPRFAAVDSLKAAPSAASAPAPAPAVPLASLVQQHTTLSVLQPLAASGSAWQPPAPPAPTIPRLTAGTSVAAATPATVAPLLASNAAEPLQVNDGEPVVEVASSLEPAPPPSVPSAHESDAEVSNAAQG